MYFYTAFQNTIGDARCTVIACKTQVQETTHRRHGRGHLNNEELLILENIFSEGTSCFQTSSLLARRLLIKQFRH